MKKTIITTILTIFTFVFVNAQSPLEKRIDFSVVRVPIKDALRQLSIESKINIAYSSQFFKKRDRVSISVKDEKVDNILSKILENATVDYKADGDQIIVTLAKPKEKKLYTISGYVEDFASGERLIAVTVYSPNHQEGVSSNEYGFYSLTIPEGETNLAFRYLGCEEVRMNLNLQSDIRKNIVLKPSLTLSEIVVVGNKKEGESDLLYNDNKESIEKIKAMPVLGKGDDLMKQISFLPGVETGSEGFGGMYVRGGNIDQNLTMLDGVNIYNPSHLLGLFSVYNVNTIKSAKLYKGDFPARYGGRISSVLDVRTKDGNMKKFRGEIAPGILNSRVALEGPIIKDKLAFYLGGRFSQINILFNLVEDQIDTEELNFGLKFYDINAKLHYRISEKDKLYLSAYIGQDVFHVNRYDEFNNTRNTQDTVIELLVKNTTDAEVDWGNTVLALRWNHLYGNQLFSNTTFTYSRFGFNFGSLDYYNREVEDSATLRESSYVFLEYENFINDFGAKIDFQYIPSPSQNIRFGAALAYRDFGSGNKVVDSFEVKEEALIDEPNLKELRDNDIENQYGSFEFNAYVENDIKVTDRFRANVGVRLSIFGNDDNSWYGSLEPRLNGKYILSDTWSLNGAITRTSQNVHLLTNSGIGLPLDIWIPAIEELRPQTAWQSSLGVIYKPSNSFKFQVEGFYKKMKNLVFLNKSIFEFEKLTTSDTTFVTGTGEAYGIEFSLEKDFNRLYTFAYYTLSKSTRNFPDINLGRTFPFQYDRPHSLKIGLLWKATKKLDIGLVWTYKSGAPRIYSDFFEDIGAEGGYTLPINNYEPGKYNGKRNPTYHRLDFKLNWTFVKKRGVHQLGFSVYNAYLRNNPFFYEQYDSSVNGQTIVVENPVGARFLIPSLNYSFKF